jgi:hypothetical protein
MATAQDQQAAQRPNAISLDFVVPALAVIQAIEAGQSRILARLPIVIDYQRVLGDRFVLGVIVDVNDTLTSSPQTVYEGDFGQLQFELDWHPFEAGMKGLYVGGNLYAQSSASLTYTLSPSDAAWSRFLELGLGATVGYEFLLPLNLLVNVAAGLGAGYSFLESTYSVSTSSSTTTSGLSVHLTRLELSLGYRF